MAFEEQRPGRADNQHRDSRGLSSQVIDELQQTLVGPVNILEHEHQRPALCQSFEEAAPGSKFSTTAVTVTVSIARQSDERTHGSDDPFGLGGLRYGIANRLPELTLGGRRVVRAEDAGMGLEDLCQRPERRLFPVGE